ncbi:MAG: tRNA (adenosine(37)-N6)-threonylcarbamoyltransferase complex dimerization subunit type 1 TsaB [Gemmatimonadaceae bacterium]
MRILSLVVDGSTYAGTVALLSGSEVAAELSLPDSGIPSRGQRAEDFMPMVAACLDEAKVDAKDLARVICGSGPGSFTSLRIAASIAKGIAAGVGCPMYSVSSLLLIPASARLSPGRYLSALPAMRGESFVVKVEIGEDGSVTGLDSERLVSTAAVETAAAAIGFSVIGPGLGNDLRPMARGAGRMLDQIVASGECDLNLWEPTYGRLAEAQVKWEAQHGRPLTADA